MRFTLRANTITFILVSGIVNAEQTEYFPHHHLALFIGDGLEKEHCHSESELRAGTRI